MNENIPELKNFFDETSRFKDAINGAKSNAELTALSSQIEPYIVNWDDLEQGLKDIDNNAKYSDEQKINAKRQLLTYSINSNNTLLTNYFENPDFKYIVKNDSILKKLIITSRYENMDPLEFIQKKKESGLSNDAIFGVLSFDFREYLSKEPQKSALNFNPDNLSLSFEAKSTSKVFNVLVNNLDKIPAETITAHNLLSQIYISAYSNNFFTDWKLSPQEIATSLQTQKFILKNFSKIIQDPNAPKSNEMGEFDKVAEYICNTFGILQNTETGQNYYDSNEAKIKLPNNLKNADLDFISYRLIKDYITITQFNNSITNEISQEKLKILNSVIHSNENESKIFSLIPKDKNAQTTQIDKAETK